MILIENMAVVIDARQFEATEESAREIVQWIESLGRGHTAEFRVETFDSDLALRITDGGGQWTVYAKPTDYVYIHVGMPDIIFVYDKDPFENAYREMPK